MSTAMIETPREELLYGGEVRLRFCKKKHSYEVSDSRIDDGKWYEIPSVTQALSIIDKSGPLTQWAANSAIEYLRTKIEPGKMYDAVQLEASFQEARFNFRKITKQAQDIGSMAHSWVEAYLKSLAAHAAIPAFPDNEEATNSCNAALGWIEEHHVEPVATEMKIYSRLYRYAGTLDMVAKVDGQLCIVDWKTSAAIYDEYHLQTAAYAYAHLEMTNSSLPLPNIFPGRWIVRIGKDGEVEPVLLPEESFGAHLDAFLKAQALWMRMKELKEGHAKHLTA